MLTNVPDFQKGREDLISAMFSMRLVLLTVSGPLRYSSQQPSPGLQAQQPKLHRLQRRLQPAPQAGHRGEQDQPQGAEDPREWGGEPAVRGSTLSGVLWDEQVQPQRVQPVYEQNGTVETSSHVLTLRAPCLGSATPWTGAWCCWSRPGSSGWGTI